MKQTLLQHALRTGSPFAKINERRMLYANRTAGKQLHLLILVLFFSFASSAQTYTTVADGDWSSPTTWAGGVVPSTTISSGMTVNIKHDVTYQIANNLTIAGKLLIVGDTLRFADEFGDKISVSATGQLVVSNGGLLTSIAQGKVPLIVYGYFKADNAKITIGKTFEALNAGKRFIRNSTVISGSGYLATGTSSSVVVQDTIQNSVLTIGANGSGHFEVKDHSFLKVANVKLYIKDGDFKTGSSGNISLFASITNYFAFSILGIGKNLNVNGPWDARIDAYCVIGDITGGQMGQIDFSRPEDCSLTPSPATMGQMVINEVYTDPGVGKHEFIELYNISTQPESVNNYTLVTYFDNWVNGINEKGFYTLDFPDFTVAPKSHFVGAAAFPFNFQGVSTSSLANFSWNGILSGSEGSLKKWILSSDNDASDGNRYYKQSTLPALGLNDLFNRLTGDVAYTFFLFKNGILVNQVIAGSGGLSTLSTTITDMPPLNVDMTGASPDFSIDFGSFKGMPVEKISQDAGSDNGFIRKTDGACGSWKKSSSQSTHTPLQANGELVTGTSGDVTVSSYITKGTEATGSTVTYTVISGSTNSFAVEIRVYLDNGTLPGQYDLFDTHIDTKTAATAGETFTTAFKPYDANVLLLVKQGAGCMDHIALVKQASMVTLPVTFSSFAAFYDAPDARLHWSANEDESFSHYVIQRSYNGSDFSDISTVFAAGTSFSSYSFKDKNFNKEAEVVYYRIKGVDKSGSYAYSPTRMIRVKNEEKALQLTAYPNPVTDQLRLTMPADWKGKRVKVVLIGMNGTAVKEVEFNHANSTELIHLAQLSKGMYLVKAQCHDAWAQQRIVKN